MIDAERFSLLFSFGIRVNGLALALFRSNTISEGRFWSSPLVNSAKASFSFLINATLTPSFRAVSCTLAVTNRSSTNR